MEMDDAQSLRLLIADCKRLVGSLSKLEKEILKEYQKQKKGKSEIHPNEFDWENEILNG